MLSPDDLIAAHEALRPPEGHRLDVAVGTTYSLDLTALLAPPVAFATFDLQSSADSKTLDGLAVLESVRRYADSITVFCQAGQIAVPASRPRALVWTEGGVIQVRRPRPGMLFHPKCWVLRYTDDAGSLQHRVIVLSRNLTFDRSWDIVVVLDEDSEAPKGVARGFPPFLRQLPSLACDPISDRRLAELESLAATVATARLAAPEPFTRAQVWPLGGDADIGRPYPSDPDRTLIISPFLTGSEVTKIAHGSPTTIVSTTMALDDLGPSAAAGATCFVAAPPPIEPLEEGEGTSPQATGLHAKIVVSDLVEAGESTWVAGSANATHNAHHGNVELVVRLTGPIAACGVESLMSGGGRRTERAVLMDLLEPYTPREDVEVDPTEAAQELLDAALIDMASAGCTLSFGAEIEPGRFPAAATFQQPIAEGVSCTCRPITYPEGNDRPVDPVKQQAEWEGMSLQAITPYLIVTASLADGTTRSRVIIADLVGAPEHRRERILAEMLRSADDFFQYLLLLLGSAGDDELAWGTAVSTLVEADAGSTARRSSLRQAPVLETLLRAAAYHPEVLPHVEALVADLRQAGVGEDVIPPAFDKVWSALSAAAGQEGRT